MSIPPIILSPLHPFNQFRPQYDEYNDHDTLEYNDEKEDEDDLENEQYY